MVAREPNFNPALIQRVIAAAAGASGIAAEALTTAGTADNNAISALGQAATANTAVLLKEQFTDRLIADPGYITLEPSGLVIEWGYSTIAGGAGQASAVYQKLTNGRFPYVIMVIRSSSVAAGILASQSINALVIVGSNISHLIDCRQQSAGVTSNAPNGAIIQWLAVGY